eukprot:TRINITY_DN1940_c0_g5_i2.p1 TRINITY_DN1940_c0_g5~~TRINITY_DN1940_c0_g5_i2.p1  ORF type:complete len:562 (+),score=138.22 TRINITY_DN1940_c0_g5_i2:48-1688(+)
MSKFDSRVLTWVKGARIVPDGKITVLDNGIECVNKFERIESHEPMRSRSPLRRQNSGDMLIQDKMETEKTNAVLEKQNTEVWAPPVLYREVFQPLGEKVPACGVAWMRSNGTLRLQLNIKKLPYNMRKQLNTKKLPVQVPELAERGNILLLEYPQERVGYSEMAMHIGPIQAGCSAEVPMMEDWPYTLPATPPPPEPIKPKKVPPPLKKTDTMKAEEREQEEKNKESEAPENGRTKLKLKKRTPTHPRKKSCPSWPPVEGNGEENGDSSVKPSVSAMNKVRNAVRKLSRQWPPPGCGVGEGDEAASPVPSPLPSQSQSPGPRNSRSSSLWTGSPSASPAARRVWGSPATESMPAATEVEEPETREVEQSPPRPKAPWGVAWTPDRSEYTNPSPSRTGSKAYSGLGWGSSSPPRKSSTPGSPQRGKGLVTPLRRKSTNPIFSDGHWDPDRSESNIETTHEGRPRSATSIPSLEALKSKSPRKWATVEYTPRSKGSPAAKTPRGEWQREEDTEARKQEEAYVDLVSPQRGEPKKLNIKDKFAAFCHEE